MSYFKHETAIIDDNVSIGSQTKIWHFSHIQSGAVIGEFCSLGQNVNVSNDVSIGSHVKIQNNVSVYEGVTIEDYVFCGPSCVFTNDLTPRSRYPKNRKYLPTTIRHDATLGANCTIVCGHEVGHHATIAAGAVVTSDVPPHALMAGVPARQIGYVCECGQVLESVRENYYTCTDCGRYYFTYSGILVEDRSKPRKRIVNGELILDEKVYYMETNALYSLINYLDKIKTSGVNVATSIYALREIIYGVKGDERDYNRRRFILRKIESNNFILYPYVFSECIAIAFNLDLSQDPRIIEEKKDLWIRMKLIVESETYEIYSSKMLKIFGVDIGIEKDVEDQYEKEAKGLISKQIELDRKAWDERRKREKEDRENGVEPKTIQIDVTKLVVSDEYEPDLDSYDARLLMSVLDRMNITYTDEDIKAKLVEKNNCDNRSALIAFCLGVEMYGCSKVINPDDKGLAGVNDAADLTHLLYLRNENHVIVSDDRIFDNITLPEMRIKSNDFLKMCQDIKIAGQEDKILP